jgi:hypothetical protein
VNDLAGVSFAQNQTGRSDIERQPVKGGDQQDRGERRDFKGFRNIQGDQEDNDGDGQIDRQKHVEEPRRQGNDDHPQDGEDQGGQNEVAVLADEFVEAEELKLPHEISFAP